MHNSISGMRDYHWHELGVDWALTKHPNEIAMFHSFRRMENHPKNKKGNGAIALAELCEFADMHDMVLKLWTAYPKLHSYYKQFGFELTSFDEYRADFVRQPGAALALAA